MHQPIRDIMTPNPFTMHASATVAQAARVMRDRDIGDVLVEDKGKLVGIVTDRDIVVRVIAEGKDPSTTRLVEGETCDLVTVSPEDDVDEVVDKMRTHAIRRIPVVENGSPVGIVSLGDLAVARDPRSVLGDISAAPATN